jgi:hypothetical protein
MLVILISGLFGYVGFWFIFVILVSGLFGYVDFLLF